MYNLLQSAFIEALGWSLVDSLWQTGALWGLYSIITVNGRRYTSTRKHNLALLLVGVATMWFLITLFINYNNSLTDRNSYSLSYLFDKNFSPAFSGLGWLNDAIPLLAIAYIAVVLTYTARISIQYSVERNGFKKSFIKVPGILEDVVAVLSKKIGVKRKVTIWLSSKAVSPFTTGFLKPIILLPVSAATNLSSSQIEAIIAHELHHIRRNDFLLNFLLVVADVILFFNPFAKLLSDIVKKERENSCDDKVVELGYDAWSYSQALFVLGNSAASPGQLTLAAAGTGKKILLARIKRILKVGEPTPSVLKPIFAFFLCLIVTITLSINSENVRVLPGKVVSGKTGQILVTTLMAPPPIVIAESLEDQIERDESTVNPTAKNGHKVITVEDAEQNSFELKGEVVLQDDVGVIFNMPTFTDDEQPLEFTMIVPEVPVVPENVTRECPPPYVPGSTFYCPVDSLPLTAPEIIRI